MARVVYLDIKAGIYPISYKTALNVTASSYQDGSQLKMWIFHFPFLCHWFFTLMIMHVDITYVLFIHVDIILDYTTGHVHARLASQR